MRRIPLLVLPMALACGDKDLHESEGEAPDTAPELEDLDSDGFFVGHDCDDGDPTVYPGAPELCDQQDNDCDGEADEGVLTTFFVDGDGDGYGGTVLLACEAGEAMVLVGGDCDDEDPSRRPAAVELCNGRDDDCDGAVDEPQDLDSSSVGGPWYPDLDEDGEGDATAFPTEACAQPEGSVGNARDCDDGDAAVHSEAEEVCDGQDNNCDGATDVLPTFSEDFDGEALEGMTLNGDADHVFDGDDGSLRLTPASPWKRGAAFVNEPFPGDRWTASFTLQIYGGSEGPSDGAVLIFLSTLDPDVIGDTSEGSWLGAAGLDGYGVEFDTLASGPGEPASGQHVGLTRLHDFESLAVNADIPPLHAWTPHQVRVDFDAGDVVLRLNGALVLETRIEDYDAETALLGFSAATGHALSDEHVVDDLVIGTACPRD